MIANGLHELGRGQLAALVTYLRHDLADLPPRPETCTFQRLGAGDVRHYRALFSAIGADWLWFSRLRMDDTELGRILGDEAVLASVVLDEDREAGLLELDFRNPDAPELAFCGLLPDALGRGLGRVAIAEALHLAREQGLTSLHVHTCSLDHPRALDFYMRAGFRPYRRAVEIFDDPRLDGTLPHDVARQVPVVAADVG
jgi:GNAT superfamily N-acetyltransferase